MGSFEDGLRTVFIRSMTEVYEAVTSFRDVNSKILEGAWETRVYTGDRQGRCCYVYTVFPWRRKDRQIGFYYSGPGDEDRLRKQLDSWAESEPSLLADHVRLSLVKLLETVGQDAVEGALAEALAQSVMEG